jgi:hypothetical protein
MLAANAQLDVAAHRLGLLHRRTHQLTDAHLVQRLERVRRQNLRLIAWMNCGIAV